MVMVPEPRAAQLFTIAVRTGRAAELLEALFTDGTATIDDNGELVIIPGDLVDQLHDDLNGEPDPDELICPNCGAPYEDGVPYREVHGDDDAR